MTDLLQIYAFGSICRGEIQSGSDVDLLAIASGDSNRLSRSMFSIYSHSKIKKIWQEGNPFAWHLHIESRLIHSSDNSNFITGLGPPAAYTRPVKTVNAFFGFSGKHVYLLRMIKPVQFLICLLHSLQSVISPHAICLGEVTLTSQEESHLT